jgi:hypothetical protein
VVGRVVKERTFHLVPWLVWLSPPHARRVVKKRTSTPSTSDRQNNGFVYYAMPRCLGPAWAPHTQTQMLNKCTVYGDDEYGTALTVCLSVCLSVCPSTYILSDLTSD